MDESGSGGPKARLKVVRSRDLTLTIGALAIAFASLLGTGVLLDTPDARRRVADFLVGAAPLATAFRDPSSDRGAGDTEIVTGAIGASQAAALPIVATRTFAADLGPVRSLEEARARWDEQVRRGLPAMLRMTAVVGVRDTASGHDLRLLAGPLPDVAAALALCRALGPLPQGCGSGRFEGQRLTP